MKVIYVSPVFKNKNGQARKVMVEAAAVKTYRARDEAVLRMQELGGIHAKPTPETKKLMNTIIRAGRKIDKEGWFSTEIRGL